MEYANEDVYTHTQSCQHLASCPQALHCCGSHMAILVCIALQVMSTVSCASACLGKYYGCVVHAVGLCLRPATLSPRGYAERASRLCEPWALVNAAICRARAPPMPNSSPRLCRRCLQIARTVGLRLVFMLRSAGHALRHCRTGQSSEYPPLASRAWRIY